MKKTYILTNFSTYLKSYSPIIVVASQIKMFTDNGYAPTLIATEGWDPPEDSIFTTVATRRISTVPVSNNPGKDATFDEDVALLYQELNEIIEDNSTVITHDLIFLPDYVKHNVAARKIAAERPTINWVHWVHSATSPQGLIKEREMYGSEYTRMLNEPFPNSLIAYPNGYDIPRVARNFSFEEDRIFEVPHATNPTEGMARIVQRLDKEKKLYEADMLMVYPLRMDRGKNAEMNVHLTAACKRNGMNVRLVFCNFQSTGDDKVVYKDELKELAKRLNVEEEVIFLSEFDESAIMEINHDAVMDLFTLSNVFLLPSKSETYSLVAQEAMLRGNFCILNQDFAPMRQIYGDNAIYKQFSGNIGIDGYNGEINTTYQPNIEAYFDDLAKAVSYYLIHDKTVRAKTWVRVNRNPQTVFKRYLEPLLYREPEEIKHYEEAEILSGDASLLGTDTPASR